MGYRIEATPLPDAVVVLADKHADERGYFMEVYRADAFEALGLPSRFPQLNQSRSRRNVVRGLHFQWGPPMGKLARVATGSAFLVAVDIRIGSPTLGRWFGRTMHADEGKQIWAPAGFARGFCALSEIAEIEYLCTATYDPRGESAIRWDDPEIGIEWPIDAPILSAKDRAAGTLREWLGRGESKHFRYEASPASESITTAATPRSPRGP